MNWLDAGTRVGWEAGRAKVKGGTDRTLELREGGRQKGQRGKWELSGIREGEEPRREGRSCRWKWQMEW